MPLSARKAFTLFIIVYYTNIFPRPLCPLDFHLGRHSFDLIHPSSISKKPQVFSIHGARSDFRVRPRVGVNGSVRYGKVVWFWGRTGCQPKWPNRVNVVSPFYVFFDYNFLSREGVSRWSLLPLKALGRLTSPSLC